MLPVETFTDAVSFLPLNGLDSVLLASRQLSSIATKCVDGIEIWVFEFFYIALYASKDSEALMAFGDSLTYVDGWDNIVDVLNIALHNSRFGNLRLSASSDDVIPLPNKSALEVEVLDLSMNGVASADIIIDIVARFRKIQVLNLFCYEDFTDFTPVIDFCRENGVRRFVDLSSGMDLM